MSKPTKKVKVNRVTKGKLPAAESLQAKPSPVVQEKPAVQPSQAKSTATQSAQTIAPKAASSLASVAQTPALAGSGQPGQKFSPSSEPKLARGPAKVSLELFNPEAHRVCVAGSFNGWKPEAAPLAPAGNGRWVGNLNVGPGRYEYLFVVDGQWQPDPNAKETVSNPFGGQNSVLIVSE